MIGNSDYGQNVLVSAATINSAAGRCSRSGCQIWHLTGTTPMLSISTLDTYRTAHVLIQQSGPEDASAMVTGRCDALLESDDVEGPVVWKRQRAAV